MHSDEDAPGLRRTMGLADVALYFVVASSNLQWLATAAATGASSLVEWILGGLLMFVPISIVVIALSSRYPDEGGMYVWSKRAFGPFAGFMTGWTYWTSTMPFFPAVLYFAAGNALFVTGSSGGALAASPAYFLIVSVAGVALGTVVNVLGLGVGKWLTNIGAVCRWAITILLIALGAYTWVLFGPATPLTAQSLMPGLSLKELIFFSIIAFAWTGPESISFIAGEVKSPRRSIPRGLAIAAPLIALIYIAGTIAVLAILKPSNVDATSGVMEAIGSVAARAGWLVLTPIAALLVTVSCLGSCGAWMGSVARIPFVAGVDRYLPSAFGRLDPRGGAPVTVVLTQGGIATILVVLGQSGASVKSAYDILVASTVIGTLIPFLFLFAAAMKLYAGPASSGDVRIPGGRFVVTAAAVVGFITTLGAIAASLFPAGDEPNKPFAVAKLLVLTLLLVGSGAAVYLSGRRRVISARGVA